MTRYILIAALGLAMAGGRAAADCGNGKCDGSCEKYGWHPLLKIKNWFGGKKGCDGCGGLGHGPRIGRLAGGCGSGNCGGAFGAGYGIPGDQMPGTLVFPNHPYARSPRDFFMYEPK